MKQKRKKILPILLLLLICGSLVAFNSFKPKAIRCDLKEARKRHLIRYAMTTTDNKTVEIDILSTTRYPLIITVPKEGKLYLRRKKHLYFCKFLNAETIKLDAHSEMKQFIEVKSAKKDRMIQVGLSLVLK